MAAKPNCLYLHLNALKDTVPEAVRKELIAEYAAAAKGLAEDKKADLQLHVVDARVAGIANPHRGAPVVQGNWKIPFLAGASNDGSKVYIDSRVPEAYHKYLAAHETAEYGLMEGPQKLPYEEAHKQATAAERQAVEADGLSWEHYEHVMDGYIRASEREKVGQSVPPDLYEKPYEHTRQLKEVQQGKAARASKKAPTLKQQIEAAEEKEVSRGIAQEALSGFKEEQRLQERQAAAHAFLRSHEAAPFAGSLITNDYEKAVDDVYKGRISEEKANAIFQDALKTGMLTDQTINKVSQELNAPETAIEAAPPKAEDFASAGEYYRARQAYMAQHTPRAPENPLRDAVVKVNKKIASAELRRSALVKKPLGLTPPAIRQDAIRNIEAELAGLAEKKAALLQEAEAAAPAKLEGVPEAKRPYLESEAKEASSYDNFYGMARGLLGYAEARPLHESGALREFYDSARARKLESLPQPGGLPGERQPDALNSAREMLQKWADDLGIDAPSIKEVPNLASQGAYYPADRSIELRSTSLALLASGNPLVAAHGAEIVAHEFGHHIAETVLKSSDAATQQAVDQDYKAWAQAQQEKETGAVAASRMTPMRAGMAGRTHEGYTQEYALSKDEWLADNAARWLLNRELRGETSQSTQGLLAKIGEKLKQLYESIKQYLGVAPSMEKFLNGMLDEHASRALGEKLLAPNGKPSNLNRVQWQQVRTPEFRAWFGDWENDPENASKVVDENGEPLVVYHGTPAGFREELTKDIGKTWVTPDREYANEYAEGAGSVIPLFANIRNPFDFGFRDSTTVVKIDELASRAFGGVETAYELGAIDRETALKLRRRLTALTLPGANPGYNTAWHWQQNVRELQNVLEDAGYDGLATREGANADKAAYAAFSVAQLKSAIGNVGEFSPANADIRYSRPESWYYSELANQVSNVKTEKAPAAQWKAILVGLKQKGVRQDELDWTGVMDWLSLQEGAVTKQQVSDYLAGNGVRVEEKTLGEGEHKFGAYTLPGGENYREILLTLPLEHKTAWRDKQGHIWSNEDMEDPATKALALRRGAEQIELIIGDGKAFRSGHYDEANILAHTRVNDRVDAEGKKVLFIEELQSDWAQEGRKKGFGEGTPNAPFVKNTKAWTSLLLKRLIAYAADSGYAKIAWTTGEQQAERYDLSKQINRITYQDNTSGGIGSPKLEGEPTAGVLKAYDLSGTVVLDKDLQSPTTEAAAYIGKEAAAKLFAAQPKAVRQYGVGVRQHELSDLDLNVGGEGMKGFYDGIVPQVANDLLRKYGGGKVETVSIPPSIEYRIKESGDKFTVQSRQDAASDWVSMGQHETRHAAEAATAEFRRSNNKLWSDSSWEQPGFDVTSQLKERAQAGLPLFARQQEAAVLDTFATPQEAIDHLAKTFGEGFRNLAANGTLVVERGKQSWEAAIKASNNGQAWIDENLRELSLHPEAEEMTLGGKVYFDIDALAKDRVAPVAIHSIGEHFHLEKMLGSQAYASLIGQITNRAKVPGSFESKVWARTAKDYAHLEVGSRAFVSEVIAKLGELQPKAPWYRRLLATVKVFMVKMGFGSMVKTMTGNDLHALLVVSMQAAARDNRSDFRIFGKPTGGMFSLEGKNLRMPDDKAYLAAVQRGDMQAAQQMVNEAAALSGAPILDDTGSTSYQVRRTASPQKTVKAYKLFATKATRPGELFPLFVGADTAVPQGIWLDAIAGKEAAPSKTGKPKVKSKLGPLAYRPGWHAGDIPLATHIGAKDADGNIFARQDSEVWAEVELVADRDYQPEANANGRTKDGSFSVPLADIKHMPEDGMYRYKTNSNMTGNWIISGSMKINRVLSEREVNQILDDAGAVKMPWKSGPLNLEKLGLAPEEARNHYKILDPVTYADDGSVIPLSKRFDVSNLDVRYSLPVSQINAKVDLGRQALPPDSPLRKITEAVGKVIGTENPLIRAATDWANAPGRATDSWMSFWVRKNQSVLRWVDLVENQLGKPLDTAQDPFFEIKRYQSRTMNLSEKFRHEEWEPFLRNMNKAGIGQEAMNDYLWARAAQDRNAKIAEVNVKYPDGGSGLLNAEAQSILSGAPTTILKGTPNERTISFSQAQIAALQALGDQYDKISAETQKLAVELDLLPQQVADSWLAEEPHYAPLFRKFDEEEDLFANMRAGTGYDVRGSISQRAVGSAREVVNVLANTELLRQRVIKQGLKVKGVGHAVFGLALAAPAPNFYVAVDPVANPIRYELPKVPDPQNQTAVNRYLRAVAKIQQDLQADKVDRYGNVVRQALTPSEVANVVRQTPVDANGTPLLRHLRLRDRMLSEKYDKNGYLIRRALTQAEAQEALEALPVDRGDTLVPNQYDNFARLVAQTIDLGNSPKDAVTGYVNELATPTYVAERIKDPVTGKMVLTGRKVVEYRINPSFRKRPGVFATEFGGVPKYVFFNEKNPEAARIVMALKNLDAPQLGKVFEWAGTFTRFIAAMNTQYSPFFGPVNLLKDVQFAYLRTKDKPFSNFRQLVGYTQQAARTLYKAIPLEGKGQTYSPTDPRHAEMMKYWEQAKEVGMPVGFTQLLGNSLEHQNEIAKTLERLQIMDGAVGLKQHAKKYAMLFTSAVANINSVLEASVRLAVFRQAVESGIAPERAGILAKDATIDFNQRGAVAAYLGPFYAFFNAGAQGALGFYSALAGKAGKQILIGGLAVGVLQAIMMSWADYDDDDPAETVRERNFILPLPGTSGPDGKPRYFSFPIPLGFNTIPNISRILTQAMLSKNKNQGAKPLFNLSGMLVESLSPLGGGPMLQILSPTAFDPFAAVMQNKNWQGRPIYREDFNSLDPTPAYLRAKAGTAPWLVSLSKFINELPVVSGGSEYRPGMLNWSPEAIDYIITQFTGGPGRELSRFSKMVGDLYTGEDVPSYEIPLVGKFIGSPGEESGVSAGFYRNLEELNGHQRELKGLRKDKPEAVASYLAEFPEAKLAGTAEVIHRTVSDLNRRKREMVMQGAPREEVKALQDRITGMMKSLNNRVDSERTR